MRPRLFWFFKCASLCFVNCVHTIWPLQIDIKEIRRKGLEKRCLEEVEIHSRLKHPSILEVCVCEWCLWARTWHGFLGSCQTCWACASLPDLVFVSRIVWQHCNSGLLFKLGRDEFQVQRSCDWTNDPRFASNQFQTKVGCNKWHDMKQVLVTDKSFLISGKHILALSCWHVTGNSLRVT